MEQEKRTNFEIEVNIYLFIFSFIQLHFKSILEYLIIIIIIIIEYLSKEKTSSKRNQKKTIILCSENSFINILFRRWNSLLRLVNMIRVFHQKVFDGKYAQRKLCQGYPVYMGGGCTS